MPSDDTTTDWAEFWIQLGGFQDANETDPNGWLPLHHATDSITFSSRAAAAARALIPLTTDLNKQTTGSQPTGYTPLHFACDGSDATFAAAEIAGMLLEYHADVDARDSKDNTPLLLAAGSGVTDVCQVLVHAGCNIKATNINGQGAKEKAWGCSPSLANWLEELGAPDTRGSSGRTRTGCSDSRQARNDSTLSPHSPYGRGGGKKGSKGGGQHGRGGKGGGQQGGGWKDDRYWKRR